MKKSICLLLVLLVALVPILVSATNNDDVETITLIKYDCITGTEEEIIVEVDQDDLTARMPALGANPNLSRQIINGNNRIQVYFGAYSSFPYSAIGLISSEIDSVKNYYTGFIVGNRTVLSSAQSVYSLDPDIAMDGAYFLPHADAGSSHTIIENNGVRVLTTYAPAEYKTNPCAANDWAILVLEEDVGTDNGIIQLYTGAPHYSEEVQLIGYGDTRAMYISPGNPSFYTTNDVSYTCDATAVNSGSPVFYITGGGTYYYAFAVHHGDDTDYSNKGCRITQWLINYIYEIDNADT